MKTSKVEATNKIAIKGDRNEPIIAAIQDIQIKHPELYKELAKVIDYELWDGYSLSIHEEGIEVKYKIEVFNNGKLHIEHSATSKEHLMQIWKGFFPLYEGWEYRVIDIVDNDVIIEGAMDNGDLEVLENL